MNRKKIYFGYSFGYIPLFQKYPELYSYTNNYDIMVTDGRLFYLFARMMGFPLKFDISIPFLSKLIMELANRNKFSMMIIGSTKEINAKATMWLRDNYRNAIVYDGVDGGKFTEKDQLGTMKRINQVSPDILFIGVSSPKKEIFASKWKDDLNVKVIVPFGGMVDGLGGKVRLTPLLLKKLGLATIIRVIQEPRRMFWLNVRFAYETFFRIVPTVIYQVVVKRNMSYFIPSLYGIKR